MGCMIIGKISIIKGIETCEELDFEPWEYESQMPARRKSELTKRLKSFKRFGELP